MPKAPSKPAAKKPAAKTASKSVKKTAGAAAPKASVKRATPLDKLSHSVAKKGPGPIPPLPVKDKLVQLKDKVVAALTPAKSKAKAK
ncbi:MAG: hypothetical protein V4650_09610 [Pseudomonadota bacterium]